MNITLSKNSDVPLRRQLAEQMVLLITTGQLREGQQLPSVRALARQLKVHHNTVSEAYQELVQRSWLNRQRGRRLVVGMAGNGEGRLPSTLDEVINESIQRARAMGYSLQELAERVRERLIAQPPDHVLVVEEEPGLRKIIAHEVHETLGCRVQSCTPAKFKESRELAVGAQLFAPGHIIRQIEPLISKERPAVPITYSPASEYADLIRSLKKPSIVAAVSVSESALKTARALFAPVVGRRHTLREILVRQEGPLDLQGVDLAFCDSITMAFAEGRGKLLYRLVSASCLEHLAATLLPLEPTK